jgi:chromosome segregation ATPase
MTRTDRAARNGWFDQAARLVVSHGTLGSKVVEATEQARRRRAAASADTDIEAAAGAREVQLESTLEAARARIAGLEKRLAHESNTTRSLSEQLKTLAAQSETAEKRVADLETELAATRDDFALREGSLQTSLDLALGDNARLTQGAGDSTAARDAALERCEFVEAALAAADAECKRVNEDFNATTQQHLIETNALASRLETLAARAGTAEKQSADAREHLNACIAQKDTAERRLAGTTTALEATTARLRHVEGLLRLKQRQVDDLEHARTELIDATGKMLQTVQSRDASLALAGDDIKVLNDRIAQLETATAAAQAGADRERETMRRNWAELARELARLMTQRRQTAQQTRRHSSAALLPNGIAFANR